MLGTTSIRAEENTFKIGLGLETNMNSDLSLTLGRSLSFELQLFKYVMNGAILTISDDFHTFTTIEPTIFVRWYFLDPRLTYTGLFVQGELGMAFALAWDTTVPFISIGLAAGYRLPLQHGDYYVEPYIRVGYPYIIGIGVKTGGRFW
jgi:hypothetical protein